MRKMKKMDADTLTAILAFQRLSGTGKSLLEGAAKDAEAGRYSIIAINPVHEIKVYQHDYYIDGTHQVVADPLKEIELFIEKAREDELELPLDSGAIGYVGYDVIALYEDLGEIPVETRDIPDIRFYVYESFVIMDHQAEELILVQDNCYSGRSEADLDKALESMLTELTTPKKDEHKAVHVPKMSYKSNYTKDEYMGLVKKAKTYIQEGDFFQIVLSQRLEADFTVKPFDYYRKLRLLNPSPYLYFIDFGDTVLIGSSPESLIKTKGRTVITNPIAGTRRRGATKQEDELLASELLSDEKELAEHRMLVDLGRNDIGKNCRNWISSCSCLPYY